MEDLKFVVEAFEEGGNLFEAPSLLHDLDTAIAAYGVCRKKVRGQAANAVPRRAPPAEKRSGVRDVQSLWGRLRQSTACLLGGIFSLRTVAQKTNNHARDFDRFSGSHCIIASDIGETYCSAGMPRTARKKAGPNDLEIRPPGKKF